MGGSGNGAGGANAGSGAGINGTNGGGGSNSNNYSYRNCTPKQCLATGWCTASGCEQWYVDCGENCTFGTVHGKSGQGGANTVNLPASSVDNKTGVRDNNGYAIIRYKIES